MKHAHLAGRVFNQALMIEESKLAVILHVLQPHFGLDPESLPAIESRMVTEIERRCAGYQVRNGTAIIGIHGTLVARTTGMDALSGLTSYQNLRQTFDTAMEDDAVRRIIFDVDSPGGEVSGCFDLADHIYLSRGKKHMTAVVNEACYSAAYALASATDRIVIPRTGGAGSVGVILCHVDQSAHNEKAGLKVTHIIAGAKKADFSPHSPLSEEAMSRIQEMVLDNYRLFVETVARNRGMTKQAVADTEAGIYFGKKAVAAGLADEVAAVDKYLTGNPGTGSPSRLAAESECPAIAAAATPAKRTASEHFADPATSAAIFGAECRDIGKATDGEKAYFRSQAAREAVLNGEGLSGDAALLVGQDAGQAKRPANFAEIAANVYARREQERQQAQQDQQPDQVATKPTGASTGRDRLAEIADRVYGGQAAN